MIQHPLCVEQLALVPAIVVAQNWALFGPLGCVNQLALHATLARFLLATVLICCGLLRAIKGVYNAMFGTSLLVHHSQRPLCLLFEILDRHVGFGPEMDIDTPVSYTHLTLPTIYSV